MFSSQTMSSATQFCISWVSYKNCLSKGFSRFQQDGEFVDMTLAADGYLVKVHQNIVALASPYLKAMIQSTPCQHPVVFLNNITQEMLTFILEYIYTGEVKIPTDSTAAFLEACKALHINGIENLLLPKKPVPQPQPQSLPSKLDVPVARPAGPPPLPPENNFAAHIRVARPADPPPLPLENNFAAHFTVARPADPPPLPAENNFAAHITVARPADPPPQPPENNFAAHITVARPADPPPENTLPPKTNFAAHITINSDNFNLEVIPNENNTMQHQTQLENDIMNYQVLTDANVVEDQNNQQDPFPPLSDYELSSPNADREENHSTTLNDDWSIDKFTPPSDREKAQHYSISNRGSLTLILNQFMYYCHHHACEGRKRRWRCVDYRRLRCPAVIDTVNGKIINRSEVHIHPNHDIKILRKFKSKKVFSSLSQAEESVQKSTERRPKVKRRKGSSSATPTTTRRSIGSTFNII